MKVYDFIGNEITVGGYIAIPGGGNGTNEYGNLLAKVTRISDSGNVIIKRLHVDYDQGTHQSRKFHPSHLKNAIVGNITLRGYYSLTRHYVNEEYEAKVAVRFQSGTIKNTNRTVVVQPTERIQTIFEKVLNSDSTVFDEFSPLQFVNWIHGSYPENNPFKPSDEI